MKKFYFVLFLFIFLVSCEKEETTDSDIPEWLESRIEELENSEHCFDCSFTRITFDNEYYYHLYCGHWSCRYCHLYNKDGNLVDLADTKFSDFLENKKDETVIWNCPD